MKKSSYYEWLKQILCKIVLELFTQQFRLANKQVAVEPFIELLPIFYGEGVENRFSGQFAENVSRDVESKHRR